MPKFTIHDRQLWKDEAPLSITGAEVHYWRLEPQYWQPVLEGAAEMGIKTIASYVQWHYHEYQQAVFDFSGKTDPKRNLTAYIELVAALGLNLIIRPGPYTFAEWNNYGIPDYVIPYHRMHPRFQEAAARWIKAVCDVIRPHLATRGGPIIMLQADNMFDLGQKRYNRQLGLYGGEGIFQEYLRGCYASVDDLNESWGTGYQSFDQAMATTAVSKPDTGVHNRWLDFQEFKFWFTGKTAEWTIDQYRQNGIDLPIHSNATKDQNPVEMARRLDVLSFNHYPTLNYSMVADEHRHLLDHVRLLRVVSPIPYIAELESGIWHGYHYTKGLPTRNHYRYMLLTILAGGATTWTWYMLHDRDNWYMSPLNSRGLKRLEVFSLFKQFIEIEAGTKPCTWEKCSKTALTYYPLHQQGYHSALEYAALDASGSMYAAGIDYTFYNLLSPEQNPALLIYSGERWLDRASQQRLIDYMQAGGRLVVFQTYPEFDERLQQCNLLEIPEPDGVETQGYMNTFYKDLLVELGGKTARVKVPQSIYLYQDVPGTPIQATFAVPRDEINDNVLEEYQVLVSQGNDERITVGFERPCGKGSLTFIGVPPSAELVTALHDYFGVEMPAVPEPSGMQTALYRTPDCHYLIVLNNGVEDKAARIILSKAEFPNGGYQVEDLLDAGEQHIQLEDGLPRALTVQVGRKNGVLLKIHPSGSFHHAEK